MIPKINPRRAGRTAVSMPGTTFIEKEEKKTLTLLVMLNTVPSEMEILWETLGVQ